MGAGGLRSAGVARSEEGGETCGCLVWQGVEEGRETCGRVVWHGRETGHSAGELKTTEHSRRVLWATNAPIRW